MYSPRSVAKSQDERAVLRSLQEIEESTWFKDDIEIRLDDVLHGTEVLPYSHGGEEIEELGKAIMEDIWNK